MSGIHEAICRGNLERIRSILQRDPTVVNDLNHKMRSPLMMLYTSLGEDDYKVNNIRDDNDIRLSILKLLIDYGADVNARTGLSYKTPLTGAVLMIKIEETKLLLESGADPNIFNCDQQTPMHEMAYFVQKEIVKLLLHYGANINAIDDCGSTPLALGFWFCINERHITFFKEIGAKIYNIYEILYLFANQLPVTNDFLDLIMKNRDWIDPYNKFSLQNFVHYANSKGGLSIENIENYCSKLKEWNIDWFDDRDETGTDLHRAVQSKLIGDIKTLLQNGVDVNALDIYGNTPLHLLLEKSCDINVNEITEILLDKGANISVVNNFGYTPFNLAVSNGHDYVLNLMFTLITGIATNNIKSKLSTLHEWFKKKHEKYDKLSVLDVASIFGDEEIVEQLLELNYGVEPCKDFFKFSKSPIHYAMEAQNFSMVKILFEAGLQLDWIKFNNYIQEAYENNFHFKVTCLILKSNNSTILRDVLYDVLRSERNNSRLTSLLLFYYTLILNMDPLNSDILCFRGFIKFRQELASLVISHKEKLENLKQEMINNDLSIFNCITMKFESLVTCLFYIDNFNSCVKFCNLLEKKTSLQIHEVIILNRLLFAIEIKNRLDVVKDFFNEIFSSRLPTNCFATLPDNIIWNIIDLLSDSDLRKILLIKKCRSNFSQLKKFTPDTRYLLTANYFSKFDINYD